MLCDLGPAHRYLFSVLWELREILLLSSTGHVALLCEFQHPENREGKTWVDKAGTVPKEAVKEHLSYELQQQISCTSPVSSCQLVPCSGSFHQGTGSNDLQIGSNTKKMGTFIKNNIICNQNKWIEDNALISQLAQPSLELLLKKWCSLLWSHPTLVGHNRLVYVFLYGFSVAVNKHVNFTCTQWVVIFTNYCDSPIKGRLQFWGSGKIMT